MKNIRVPHMDVLKLGSKIHAYKRPEEIMSGASDKIVPGTSSELEETKKLYNLQRRFSQGVGDVPFDYTGMAQLDFNAAIPNETQLIRYQVPASTDLILTQYLFFILITNYQAVPYPREFADPLEFFQNIDFFIRINGKLASFAAHSNWNVAGTPVDMVRAQDGYLVLTKDPNGDSNPNYGGLVIVAPKNSVLTVHARIFLAVNLAQQRNPNRAGCRIRGFLTTSEELTEKQK